MINIELPQAPLNASPVPYLTSIHSSVIKGRYGSSKYPGNCGGDIIKDLLLYFQPRNVFDPKKMESLFPQNHNLIMTNLLSNMTAKEKVLAWVRSRNPDTMELKPGCRVRCNGKATGIFAGDSGRTVIKHWVERNGHLIQRGRKIREDEILGSDMGLREFCRALTYSGFYHTMNHNFKFSIKEKLDHPETIVEWDDEQNLHNQSDEFYESILLCLSL